MAALPSANWNEAASVFEQQGWSHDRTKGSHYIMTKPGEPALLSIPMHKPVKKGTLRRLIRTAGMSVGEFVDLLRD